MTQELYTSTTSKSQQVCLYRSRVCGSGCMNKQYCGGFFPLQISYILLIPKVTFPCLLKQNSLLTPLLTYCWKLSIELLHLFLLGVGIGGEDATSIFMSSGFPSLAVEFSGSSLLSLPICQAIFSALFHSGLCRSSSLSLAEVSEGLGDLKESYVKCTAHLMSSNLHCWTACY